MLGPVKYFTTQLMERLKSDEKNEIQAKLESLHWSGLPSQLSPNSLCNYSKSLLGRDFKLIVQVGLYIFWEHLDVREKEVAMEGTLTGE